MTEAGKLDKRITLQMRAGKADGMGGRKPAWHRVATVWAEFRKPSVQTVAANGTVLSILTREIGIRYRDDVCKGWRVEYGGKVFEVKHTYDLGRKEKTVLVCQEIV